MDNQINQNNYDNTPIGKPLASFIVSILGLAFSSTAILCIPGLVLGIVGIALSKNSQNVNKMPYTVFRRIAYPMGIVAIVLGALFATLWIAFFIYLACGGKIPNVSTFIL